MLDNLDKDIEKIKVSRMKPIEKYLYEIVKNLINCKSEIFSDVVYYKNLDDILFIYSTDLKIFWCKNSLWILLQEEYNLTYFDVQKNIKNIICKYLKLKEAIPEKDLLPSYYWEQPYQKKNFFMKIIKN